jgi:hypothetical protein
MVEVLDDRNLPAFQIADTSHEFLQLALNSVLACLKALEVFEDDVLSVFSHFPVSLVKAATSPCNLASAGEIISGEFKSDVQRAYDVSVPLSKKLREGF